MIIALLIQSPVKIRNANQVIQTRTPGELEQKRQHRIGWINYEIAKLAAMNIPFKNLWDERTNLVTKSPGWEQLIK